MRFAAAFKLGMWTPATRGRMAKIEKKTKRYPSDLTDEECARIKVRLTTLFVSYSPEQDASESDVFMSSE